jgi:ribonuclease Z
MISTFGLLGRTASLHVYAHKQLKEILDREIQMYCHDLGYEVLFHAIDPSEQSLIYEDRSLTIETIPLNHRMPTCGFLFREKPTLPHIRRDMIDFYHIPISQIMNIKNGADWTTEEGEFVPNDRLVIPSGMSRSYAYCSDTCYLPDLHRLLQGVSTLYHESTYAEDNLKMAQKYYHSTARQAATVARDAKVGQLILGHYSSRYEDENILLREACEVFPNTRLANEMDIISV